MNREVSERTPSKSLLKDGGNTSEQARATKSGRKVKRPAHFDDTVDEKQAVIGFTAKVSDSDVAASLPADNGGKKSARKTIAKTHEETPKKQQPESEGTMKSGRKAEEENPAGPGVSRTGRKIKVPSHLKEFEDVLVASPTKDLTEKASARKSMPKRKKLETDETPSKLIGRGRSVVGDRHLSQSPTTKQQEETEEMINPKTPGKGRSAVTASSSVKSKSQKPQSDEWVVVEKIPVKTPGRAKSMVPTSNGSHGKVSQHPSEFRKTLVISVEALDDPLAIPIEESPKKEKLSAKTPRKAKRDASPEPIQEEKPATKTPRRGKSMLPSARPSQKEETLPTKTPTKRGKSLAPTLREESPDSAPKSAKIAKITDDSSMEPISRSGRKIKPKKFFGEFEQEEVAVIAKIASPPKATAKGVEQAKTKSPQKKVSTEPAEMQEEPEISPKTEERQITKRGVNDHHKKETVDSGVDHVRDDTTSKESSKDVKAKRSRKTLTASIQSTEEDVDEVGLDEQESHKPTEDTAAIATKPKRGRKTLPASVSVEDETVKAPKTPSARRKTVVEHPFEDDVVGSSRSGRKIKPKKFFGDEDDMASASKAKPATAPAANGRGRRKTLAAEFEKNEEEKETEEVKEIGEKESKKNKKAATEGEVKKSPAQLEDQLEDTESIATVQEAGYHSEEPLAEPMVTDEDFTVTDTLQEELLQPAVHSGPIVEESGDYLTDADSVEAMMEQNFQETRIDQTSPPGRLPETVQNVPALLAEDSTTESLAAELQDPDPVVMSDEGSLPNVEQECMDKQSEVDAPTIVEEPIHGSDQGKTTSEEQPVVEVPPETVENPSTGELSLSQEAQCLEEAASEDQEEPTAPALTKPSEEDATQQISEELAEPSEESAETSEEPTELLEEPTEAPEEPTELLEQPTEASEEPFEELNEASEEPTEAAEGAVGASGEPTEHYEEPAAVSNEHTEPSEEHPEPSEEPLQPSEEQTEPAESHAEASEEQIDSSVAPTTDSEMYAVQEPINAETESGNIVEQQHNASIGSTFSEALLVEDDGPQSVAESNEQPELVDVLETSGKTPGNSDTFCENNPLLAENMPEIEDELDRTSPPGMDEIDFDKEDELLSEEMAEQNDEHDRDNESVVVYPESPKPSEPIEIFDTPMVAKEATPATPKTPESHPNLANQTFSPDKADELDRANMPVEIIEISDSPITMLKPSSSTNARGSVTSTPLKQPSIHRVHESSRKRSLSASDTDVVKKNVTFHSPANSTILVDTLDERLKKNFKNENEQPPAKTHRKRSLSEHRELGKAGPADTVKPTVVNKLPNFKNIHQQQFKRMESITDYHNRKVQRAKEVLAKNLTKSPAAEALVRSVERPQQHKSIVQGVKPTFKTGNGTNSSHTKSPAKAFVFRSITSNPDTQKPLSNADRMEKRKEQFQAAFKPRTGISTPDSDKRSDGARRVIEQSRHKQNQIIKGVRTNKRFELLMKFRDAHD